MTHTKTDKNHKIVFGIEFPLEPVLRQIQIDHCHRIDFFWFVLDESYPLDR